MLDRLTAEEFRPLLGAACPLDLPGHSEAITLVEVTDGRAVPPAGFRKAFSLVFEGRAGQARLPQSIRA